MNMAATPGDLVVIIGRQQVQIEILNAQIRHLQAAACPEPQAHAAHEEPMSDEGQVVDPE
jgi:hypothetical protein